MYKKLFIAAFLLLFTATSFANEKIAKDQEKPMSFHLISSDKDYVTQGKTYIYKRNDGVFSAQTNQDKNQINFMFEEFQHDPNRLQTYWRIDFGVQKPSALHIGKFTKCTRMGYKKGPILDLWGCHRGNNASIGKFEILEVTFNEIGVVESFAANATLQSRPNGSPVFAGVRYNSTIPVEVRVSDIFGIQHLPESFFCYVFKNKKNEILEQKFNTDRDFEFDYAFHDLAERMIVDIKKGNEIIGTLEFGTSEGKAFETGITEEETIKDRQSRSFSYESRIAIRHNDYIYSEGQFKVLSCRKNKYGKVKELAINFKVVDWDDNVLEGAIRYHSDLPVNLDSPYSQ